MTPPLTVPGFESPSLAAPSDGAGPAFDGLYYVKRVTHKIKRGEYKQDFTLTRNGLVSTVSTVNP